MDNERTRRLPTGTMRGVAVDGKWTVPTHATTPVKVTDFTCIDTFFLYRAVTFYFIVLYKQSYKYYLLYNYIKIYCRDL